MSTPPPRDLNNELWLVHGCSDLSNPRHQVRHENLLTMVRKYTESIGILEEYSKDLAQTSEDIELLSAPEKGLLCGLCIIYVLKSTILVKSPSLRSNCRRYRCAIVPREPS